jgi:fatty acid desaturase
MQALSTLSKAFWLLVISLVVLFVFFVALGAFKPGEVAGLTIGVALMAVLWFVHATWVSRHNTGRDPESIRTRERRGF